MPKQCVKSDDATAYGFDERLRFSDGIAASASVECVLLSCIPGATQVRRATRKEDRDGTDWWVDRHCGDALSVDAKVRSTDWLPRGEDDLALETWSVVEKGVTGWTRTESKRTDYILWLWQDTGRWCIVAFPMLCGVMCDHWEEWRRKYKTKQQWTDMPCGRGYHSECVFVPRREVWAAMYRKYGGTPR